MWLTITKIWIHPFFESPVFQRKNNIYFDSGLLFVRQHANIFFGYIQFINGYTYK